MIPSEAPNRWAPTQARTGPAGLRCQAGSRPLAATPASWSGGPGGPRGPRGPRGARGGPGVSLEMVVFVGDYPQINGLDSSEIFSFTQI